MLEILDPMFKYSTLIFFFILPLLIWITGFLFFTNLIQQFTIPNTYSKIIMLLIVSPILEETVFRGLIQDYIVSKVKSKWITVVIVSLLFAAFHYRINPNFLYLTLVFASGVVFSWTKLLYVKLLFPISLHSYYNVLYILCLLFFRGMV